VASLFLVACGTGSETAGTSTSTSSVPSTSATPATVASSVPPPATEPPQTTTTAPLARLELVPWVNQGVELLVPVMWVPEVTNPGGSFNQVTFSDPAGEGELVVVFDYCTNCVDAGFQESGTPSGEPDLSVPDGAAVVAADAFSATWVMPSSSEQHHAGRVLVDEEVSRAVRVSIEVPAAYDAAAAEILASLAFAAPVIPERPGCSGEELAVATAYDVPAGSGDLIAWACTEDYALASFLHYQWSHQPSTITFRRGSDGAWIAEAVGTDPLSEAAPWLPADVATELYASLDVNAVTPVPV
jgi:hypothetical protein